MKFQLDHDYHIHSQLSSCSGDPRQTARRILDYARENRLKELCITDHFWSENVSGASGWYAPQNYAHISQILPLPQEEDIPFFFGCETDMDKHFRLGISQADFDKFDFVIIPTTHLHMGGFTLDEADGSIQRRAELYLERLHSLLDRELPFHKIGIAHLTCPLIAPASWEDHLAVLDRISDEEYAEAFRKLAARGAGFELNTTPSKYAPEDLPRVLRPYRIAKEAGCRFYLGSDAHHPQELDTALERAADIVSLLALEEKDRFRFPHPNR